MMHEPVMRSHAETIKEINPGFNPFKTNVKKNPVKSFTFGCQFTGFYIR